MTSCLQAKLLKLILTPEPANCLLLCKVLPLAREITKSVKICLSSGTEGSLRDESAAALPKLKVIASFTPAVCSAQNTVFLIAFKCKLSRFAHST